MALYAPAVFGLIAGILCLIFARRLARKRKVRHGYRLPDADPNADPTIVVRLGG